MLAERAASELQRTTGTDASDLPLLDYIPATDRKAESPTHLRQVTEAIESIDAGETIRVALSVPPRHWKTETLLNGVVWLFQRHPGISVLYLTYGQDQAERKSRVAQRLAKRAGVKFGERNTFSEWETDNGSLFRAAGIISGATGDGFDLIIVDDPYRKRADAESSLLRGRVLETFEGDIYTRQGNTPTSFVVVHTRWHVDDLIGNITDPDFQDGQPFGYINLPAVNDQGEALLPKHWPLERLRPFMSNKYEWASQFQGNPVPRGASVFDPPTTCSVADLPSQGRYAIGVDLAYTAKTHADYSVAVVLCMDAKGRAYVMDVVRKQCRSPDFVPVLRTLADRYRGALMWWYASGTERGAADFIVDRGISLQVKQATTDKLQRTQHTQPAWNEQRIIVPRDATWSRDFLDEVCGFTGVGDAHDDMVDALVAAYDALDQGLSAPRVHNSGRRRVGNTFREAF